LHAGNLARRGRDRSVATVADRGCRVARRGARLVFGSAFDTNAATTVPGGHDPPTQTTRNAQAGGARSEPFLSEVEGSALLTHLQVERDLRARC
jgi:hypothetical protein